MGIVKYWVKYTVVDLASKGNKSVGIKTMPTKAIRFTYLEWMRIRSTSVNFELINSNDMEAKEKQTVNEGIPNTESYSVETKAYWKKWGV